MGECGSGTLRMQQANEHCQGNLKWAAAEELLKPEIYHGLTVVSGLQKGRTQAREKRPVRSVDDSVIETTLPVLNQYARGLVEFQRLTGCRPGETCAIRIIDIDMRGDAWLYRPTQHKIEWRGRTREISIGPKAQMLIKEFMGSNPEAYLFSPKSVIAEFQLQRRKKQENAPICFTCLLQRT